MSRKMAQLAQERNGPVEEPTPDTVDAVTQVEDEDLPELDPSDDDGQPEGEDSTEDLLPAEEDEEPENLDQQIQEAQARAEEAESAQLEMRRDYTLKTMELAKQRDEAQGIVERLSTLESSALAQEQQQLEQYRKQLANPAAFTAEQYRDASMQLAQAEADMTRRKQGLEQFRAEYNKQFEAMKSREAANSYNVLTGLIPNYGREVYEQAVKYGVKTGMYSAEELAEVTDFRVIYNLHKLQQYEERPQVVSRQRRRKGKPRASQRERKQIRQTNGRFAKAQDLLRQNPGDRGAARNFFAEKLRREREG